jgi:hypothetical protein
MSWGKFQEIRRISPHEFPEITMAFLVIKTPKFTPPRSDGLNGWISGGLVFFFILREQQTYVSNWKSPVKPQ